MAEIAERIARARELLQTVRHVPLATVNSDGSPHNSPVFAAFDRDSRFYWASHPASEHSKNIARTGQVFAVLFDSLEKGGGLYIRAEAHEVEAALFNHALTTFNRRRQQLLRETLPREFFTGGTQKLYVAIPQQLWVNIAQRNGQGLIQQDQRHEITSNDLHGGES